MIVSNPDQAQIYLNDDSLGTTPYYTDNIGYSSFSLRIQKNEYMTLDTLIEIQSDSLEYLSFRLTMLPRLSIKFYPEDADIMMNGISYDQRPFEQKSLLPGKYQVTIGRPGYLPYEKTITLEPGDNLSLDATLIREPLTSSLPAQVADSDTQISTMPAQPVLTRLRVESNPPDAHVWLDDKEISGQTTPLEIDNLAPGNHTVRIEKNGFRSFYRDMILSEQEENKLRADLVAGLGELEVFIQPWGSIFIDGELKKKDTNIKYATTLLTGEHLLKVEHPVYGEWKKLIMITEDKTTRVPVNFNDQVNLSVTAFDADGNPIWAEIVVDDKLTGELTPKEISVRIGERTIAAKKDGYILVNGERKLMVDSNLNKPIKFIFKKVL